MRCLFINLAEAVDRRRRLEESFSAFAPDGWTLERIEAVGGESAASLGGRLSVAEQGCFESHRLAIVQALQAPGDVLILEDDTLFGPRSFVALQDAVRTQADWDVLMTAVGVPSPQQMIWCAALREAGEAPLRLVDLASISFVGATSYVVREAAKEKLLDLVSMSERERPYDIELAALVAQGRLKASCCIPFLTGMSDDAERSQIRNDLDVTDATLNAFRRLMFVDRDEAACRAEGERLAARLRPSVRLHRDALAGLLEAVVEGLEANVHN